MALIAMTSAALLGFLPDRANGTFPGRNGRIAFDAMTDCDIRPAVATIKPGQKAAVFAGGPGCATELMSTASPQWTADGSRLFVNYAPGGPTPETRGQNHYATMRPDGSDVVETPLFFPGVPGYSAPPPWPKAAISDAALSRDGRRLAFARPGKLDAVIWTANLDGAHARRLRYGIRPRWSPDGRTIAYIAATTYDRYGRRVRGGEISLMRARTGRLIRRLGPSLTSDGGPSGAYSLDWSPDGRQLLYSPMACCDLFADVHLYVERVDGTGRRQLTFARGQDVSGVWSPDGRRIAFVRIRAREGVGMLFSIWTIPVRGGRATRIWSLPVLDDPELEFGPYNTPRISWQPLPHRGSR